MGFPLIGLIGSVGSALIGASAASKAAKAQAQATRYAADITKQNQERSIGLLQPQIDAGNTARGYQLGSLGLPGGVDRATAEAAFRDSPGYQWAFGQGQNAVQSSAAAGGRLFSGKTLKDLSAFGQGMADQSYGNWFSRLGGLSGAGSAATGQAVGVGGDTTRSLASLAVEGGNNRASSYVAGANALTGGLQNLSDMYSYYHPPSWVKSASAAVGQKYPMNVGSNGMFARV